MLTVFKIISKNFKLLTRSKASSLIIIIGPLLLMFLVGIAFDTTNKYNINIGVYSQQFNNVTDNFIEKLNQKNFKVYKYTSEEECVDHIKTGRIHTCIVFPPNMEFKAGVTNNITFNIDYSKIDLVWIILDTISEQISATGADVSEQLTNIILSKLNDARDKLDAKKAAISDLKAKNSQIRTSINKIKTDLANLDLSITQQDFRIPELKLINDEIKSNMFSMKNDTAIRIQEMRTDLDSVRTRVSNLNLSNSTQSPIIYKIDLVNGNLIGVDYKLNKVINSTDFQWNDMNNEMMLLENTANRAVNTIKGATTTRTASSESITQMTQMLDESTNALNSIDQTFNEITTSIGSIQVNTAQGIVHPITTIIKPVTQESTQLNYLFPKLMILVIMFISILLATTIIMMEKHSPAHFRNFITPINDVTFVLGSYLTGMILVTAQIIIIIIVSSLFFKTQIISNLAVISTILLITTSTFTLFGMIIGYIFDSEETATLAAVSIGTILLLLSNTILPLETMPEYIGAIAQYNPFVLSSDMLRKAILFSPPLETFKEGAILLLSLTIVLFLITWMLQKNYKRNYIHQIEKKFFRKKREIK